MSNDMMKRILAVFVVGLLATASLAADTWRWLGNYTCKKVGTGNYGYARNFETNWINMATGQYGIPANGDFIVVTSKAGTFGSDFTAANVFGGLTYEATSGSGGDQCNFALQAGGPGLVVRPNVEFESKIKVYPYFNGSILFTGSGDAIVDVQPAYSNMVFVQKSLYGNADITLVKKGVGILANSEGYAQNEARDKTNGYYANRKFVFGGVKLQGGVLAMRQYYWVRDCDFQFDGEGVGLYLGRLQGNERPVSYHSLVLSGGRFRETANVIGQAHYVEGEDAECGLQFVGTQQDTSFSGAFKGGAGIIWQPDNAATFTFRKSVSPTAGILVVSNGTLRVTEGAGLPNVSAITVSGADATFRVDATGRADFSGAALEIANGGTLSLADGLRMTVASAIVDGATVASGLYHGAGAVPVTGSVQANWIGGAAYVRVGALDGDEVTVTPGATQTIGGANVTLVQTTAQTWDVGNGTLTVAGEVTPAGGAPLLIKGSGGTLNLNAGTTGWVQPLVISNLLMNLNGVVFGAGESPVYIYHNGNNQSPTYADGTSVNRDLWFIDTSKASAGNVNVTIPANAAVTFNGYLQVTNTAGISITLGAGSTTTFNKLIHSRNGGGFKGNGTAICKGPVHFRDRPWMKDNPTVELWSTGNRLSGNLGEFNGGRLKTMVPYAVDVKNTRRQPGAIGSNNSSDGAQNTMMNAANSFTLDLCGNDQSIDQMGMYRGGGHVYSETPATFHLITADSDWPSHNVNQGGTYASDNNSGYERMDKGWWEGAVNLSYEAASATKCRFMMRQSPSTGRVEVVSGTLVFMRRAATSGETFDLKHGTGTASMAARLSDEDGGWTNATAVVVKGGTLELEHSKVFGPQTVVKFVKTSNAYGKIKLADGVRQRVYALEIDGVDQRRGTYGATGSGAQHVNDTLFTGGGHLSVVGDGQGLVILFK